MSVVVGAAILTGGGGGAFGGDGGFGCFLPTRDRERRGWRDCVWQAIGVAGMNLQWPEAQGVQHPSQRSTSQGSGDLTEPAAPGRYRRGAERGRDILGGHQFPLVHCPPSTFAPRIRYKNLDFCMVLVILDSTDSTSTPSKWTASRSGSLSTRAAPSKAEWYPPPSPPNCTQLQISNHEPTEQHDRPNQQRTYPPPPPFPPHH